MGTYTPNLKFYKPAATEFVDVDVQLNSNWKIADSAVRRLFEYEYTNLAVPPTDNSVLSRSRWYKPYSNSVMMWFGPPNNFFYQDPAASVSQWIRVGNLLNPGMEEHPDYPLAYRLIKNAAGTLTTCEWSGALFNDGNPMTLNNNVASVFTLPTPTIPVVSKYFTMWSGNTSSDFSIGRVGFFNGSNDLQYKRYGVDPAFGDEARLELTGIKYNVEVTGT